MITAAICCSINDMLTQTRWRLTADSEPWNPTQKALTSYCGLPGGYCNTYYNREPNITNLFGPDLGGVNIDEVPEAYGTIPGVYGPFGMETATLVPATGPLPPGVYDPSQNLEILLNGAMGLGAEDTPKLMSTTSKILWLAGAVAAGAAAGFVGCKMMKG